MTLIDLARQFDFVRETEGPNRGHYVDAMNEFARAPLGSSWCASFVSFLLWTIFKRSPGLPITASCEELRQAALSAGMISPIPVAGGLYLRIDPATGLAHHVGIVTGVNPLTGIAGNTSPDGTSTNGVGVFEHPIGLANLVFVELLGGGQ